MSTASHRPHALGVPRGWIFPPTKRFEGRDCLFFSVGSVRSVAGSLNEIAASLRSSQ